MDLFRQTLNNLAILLLPLLLAGCGGSTQSETDDDLPDDTQTAAPTLTWQAPTQRMNGEQLTSDELSSYEIWFGSTEESLFLIETFTPTLESSELSVDLRELLDEPAMQLTESGDTTYYIGIIAVDSDGQRSMMSELKALSVSL